MINRASRTVDPTFALVLGLELNVVLRRRLYPRALLTPFTDNVDLTDADKRAYTAYAKAQRHKGFEEVHVTFAPKPQEEEGRHSESAQREDA